MGLQLTASGQGVHLTEAFFAALGPLLDRHPRLGRLGHEEFYGSPTVRDVAALQAEVHAVRSAWLERRRAELAEERGVTATGPVREQILDRLVQGDPVLATLDALSAVCEVARSAGLPVTGLGD